MRPDTFIFATHNVALTKEPRFVVEVAFDEANTILWYFTSHADAALPGGGGLISTVIQEWSSASQSLNPDAANSTIGNIDFLFVDIGGNITSTLGTQLALGRSTRQQRVRAYMGYKGDAWADYMLVQTQLVSEIQYDKGNYRIVCNDVQREMRQDIFDVATNTLSAPLGAAELTIASADSATSVTLSSTANFPTSGSGIVRDPSFLSGAHDNDFFAWTGKTATQLTGCSGLLSHGIGAIFAGAVVNVSFDTSTFETVVHGSGWSDAPNLTVGYLRIQDEIIRYTSKSTNSFTISAGGTRGALNTRVADHSVDISLPAERRESIKEYVYLELPLVDCIYRILTGKDRLGNVVMPTSWNLGIPTQYVRLTDFTSIGDDLWVPTNELLGFPVRFEDFSKTDGKKFIEQQLALLGGVFLSVHSDGALGLRRMAPILSGAAPIATFDKSNVISADPLVHDFNSLRNIIFIKWNWDPIQQKYTRIFAQVDASSIAVHKKGNPLNLEFRGLHGSRHSEAMLRGRFDSIRDRYTGPPQRTTVRVLGRFNPLEAGDIIRLRLTAMRDFVGNTTSFLLDRGFEIQQIGIDWVKQVVSCKLFGSTRQPSAIAATTDSGFISQAWYIGTGTPLSSVVTITGSNPAQIAVGGTLSGNASLTNAGAIYYFDGDLQLNNTGTLILGNNVWIRVRGHFQNNGTITGIGGGLAGGAAVADNSAVSAVNHGVAAFIGNTEPGGGMILRSADNPFQEFRGDLIQGRNVTMPAFNITWDGTTVNGVPSDLRGSSGSSGGNISTTGEQTGVHFPALSWNDTFVPGGAGGNGGAGFALTCRGFSQGASARIDLSGADGSLGGTVTSDISQVYWSGSGAGGAPGGFLIMLDGANVSATDLGDVNLKQFNGKTPIPAQPAANILPLSGNASGPVYSDFPGTGDGTTFDLPNLSGDARGGTKTQYVINTGAPVADLPPATLSMPSSFSLVGGTSELLKGGDGTIITRVKATWTPAVGDSRVVGYDIQFKQSTESLWQSAPSILGASSSTTWVSGGIVDGVNYDFRIRSAGATREVSDWFTIEAFFVLGKTAKPADVGTATYNEPVLNWPPNTADPDLAGYIVQYQPNWSSTDWNSALIPQGAGDQGFITPTEFDTGKMVGGQVTMLVKCIDTTGNESTNVSSKQIDLRPPVPTGFTVTRQPDGTRELAWILASPPSDLDGFVIRYLPGSTSDWTAMLPFHTGILKASPFESNQLAAGSYTFAIKSQDKAGNQSATALFIDNLTIGDPRIAGSIDDFLEEPTWTETKTNAILDGATGWLIASGSGSWNTTPTTWDTFNSWIVTPSGSIQYERLIDVGIVTSFIPLVTVLADSAGGSVTIEEAHSNTGSGYSSFVAVGPELTTRFIKIRVTVTGTFPKLKSMRTILSATPLVEEITDLSTSTLTGSHRIGTGDIRLPITLAFSVIKKVDVTLQSVGAGYSVELIDKDITVGPRIKIYNSSNTLADALIDATVKGV